MHPLPPPRRSNAEASSDPAEARDHAASETAQGPAAGQDDSAPSRPGLPSALLGAGPSTGEGKKRRKHRGGKRKKNRRQSFAAPSETSTMPEGLLLEDPLIEAEEMAAPRKSAYYGRGRNGNLSDASMDSEALLDHRDQPFIRPRRDSRAIQNAFGTSHRSGMFSTGSMLNRQDSALMSRRGASRVKKAHASSGEESGDGEAANDRTPLISGSSIQKSPAESYGLFKKDNKPRQESSSTSSGRQQRRTLNRGNSFPRFDQEFDVNNPPSMPPSPQLPGDSGVSDVMVSGGDFLTRSPDSRRNLAAGNRDALIDIDGDNTGLLIANSEPGSPRPYQEGMQRRRTINLPAPDDVCLPPEALSELADEDYEHERDRQHHTGGPRRGRRHRGYPLLWVLDEWSREEKEERMDGIRAKRINEPVLVEGRLRPSKGAWHRRPEDLPYRFTYFNEEFESTIHAQTISELVQPGGSFRDLFIPDPPELSDSESDEEEEKPLEMKSTHDSAGPLSPRSQVGEDGGTASRLNSLLNDAVPSSRDGSGQGSKVGSGVATPSREEKASSAPHTPRPKKYGRRPAFWLDVMCPTNQEMQVLCKTFGIHALTAEDIMMQEAREKVELFRHYYFINYRTFEQDTNSDDYLEPLNMYVVVFPTGVLSFHFSQIPHPANVRRRIRMLTDYLELSADWIAYGIIDDITDVYQPLIQTIEADVDEIDERILTLFQDTDELSTAPNSINNEKGDGASSTESVRPTGFDFLRGIGENRKKVMSLYRLLGNKADVIKGFAKRCNEQWEVAPKSEIGLYLGDIQDHILTMTSNLSHYETLLSRAHSNYLAQINIRMNERQEKTADVLGKLTVVGTIVLPMNIICGMWGMNVKVPGQDIDNLYWFWSITAGLAIFATVCFYWCKKVYGIV